MINNSYLLHLSCIFSFFRVLYYIYSSFVNLKKLFCRYFLFFCTTCFIAHLFFISRFSLFVLHCTTFCITSPIKTVFVVHGMSKWHFFRFSLFWVLVTIFLSYFFSCALLFYTVLFFFGIVHAVKMSGGRVYV